jgi:DNA-binding MarR family transcriptional regulator
MHSPRTDEVDRMVEGWERARPDLDTSALAVFSRISRLAHHLETARRDAFAGAGIEGWEFDVLSALRRAGDEPLSPGALMRQTLVTSGTMTTRLDKLAAKHLVRRERDPHDGRGVRVLLLPAGRDAADDAMARLLAAEREALSVLPAAQQQTLADSLRLLLLPYENEDH